LFLLISLTQSKCQTTLVINKKVDLSSCDVIALTSNYFGTTSPENLSPVLAIDLSKNRLKIINNATFVRVSQLESLDLSDNHISYLETAAFEGLEWLKTLNLGKNLLATIYFDIFTPCIRLRYLDFRTNFLSKLENHQNLTLPVLTLYLSFNELEDASALSHLPHLKSLWLGNNRNLSLQQNIFFLNPEIEFLDISNTGLKAKQSLQFLTNIRRLKQLILNRNDLAGLNLENLPTLPNLQILFLGSCNLDKLNYNLIKKKFPHLKQIFKGGNRFECKHSEEIENYLQSNGIEVVRNKSTRFDIDDDKRCVPDSFDISLLLVIVFVIIGATIVIYIIARISFIRYNKKSSADDPSISYYETVSYNVGNESHESKPSESHNLATTSGTNQSNLYDHINLL
jgi:Leucine-rich repeat (LRR) protein